MIRKIPPDLHFLRQLKGTECQLKAAFGCMSSQCSLCFRTVPKLTYQGKRKRFCKANRAEEKAGEWISGHQSVDNPSNH